MLLYWRQLKKSNSFFYFLKDTGVEVKFPIAVNIDIENASTAIRRENIVDGLSRSSEKR
jgi:hypothetical protein